MRAQRDFARVGTNLRAVKLKALSEAECYERCFGTRDPTVRVVARVEARREPPPRPSAVRMSGEDLRRLFEQRLDAREDVNGNQASL